MSLIIKYTLASLLLIFSLPSAFAQDSSIYKVNRGNSKKKENRRISHRTIVNIENKSIPSQESGTRQQRKVYTIEEEEGEKLLIVKPPTSTGSSSSLPLIRSRSKEEKAYRVFLRKNRKKTLEIESEEAIRLERNFAKYLLSEKEKEINKKVSDKQKIKSIDAKLLFLERGLPLFSPIPPPPPSTSWMIPKNLGKEEINKVLLKALDKKGYDERGYYQIEDGIAIITLFENIDIEKVAFKQKRWQTSEFSHSWKEFSFSHFVKKLFLPQKNNCRLFLFWITRGGLSFSTKSMTSPFNPLQQKSKYPHNPDVSLDEYLSSDSYSCHVLVYEYSKKEFEKDFKPVRKGDTISAKKHLEKAGLLEIFNRYDWN